jgi:hypothetical protein
LLCKQILELQVSCSDFKITQLEELKKAIPDTGFDKIQKIILTNRIDTEIQNQESKLQNQKIDSRLDKISKNLMSISNTVDDQVKRTSRV